MSDLETRLQEHFAARTHDLPNAGPGLDEPGVAVPFSARRSRYAAITALAAASILVIGLGGLLLLDGDRDESVSTAETGPPPTGSQPTPTEPQPSASSPGVEDPLQPIETLPDSGDVSETPITVASTEPTDWYRVAADLDIAWYSDDAGPSMFCWRTPAVTEPQCSVDGITESVYPLVVPTAGDQTLVFARADRSNPVTTVSLDDGSELAAALDVDDIIDTGVARFALAPGRSIVAVDGQPVSEPIGIDEYIPAPLLDFVGLDLDDFTEQAEAFGFTTRVVVEDGAGRRVTADFKGDRINVATVDGTVTELFPVG